MTGRVANLGPVLAILVAAAVGLALRLPALEQRPLHTDEAVHGIILGRLIEEGVYHYDPHDYHGPTLYYASLPVAILRGEHNFTALTATTLRLVPVIFGVGTIVLVLLARPVMGDWAAVAAAWLLAVSPMASYYSRYYIQETLLVFFTLGLLLALARLVETGNLGWAVLAGVWAGLMHASKETCVITWFAIAAGILVVGRLKPNAPRPSGRAWLVVAGTAVVVSVACFSVFFTQWHNVVDSVTTYAKYFQRGQGSGHEKPWFYYLKMFTWHRVGGLGWTEMTIVLLAILGAVQSCRQRVTAGVFLTVYVVVLGVVYALIPYKTPWSALTWTSGLTLLAGIGVAGLARWRGVAVTVLAVAVVHLGWQARRTNGRFAADERNPYVYSHTVADAVRLAERIRAVLDGRTGVVKVMAKEYWPLPWYLRGLPAVGYWNKPANVMGADVLVTSPEFGIELGDEYVVSLYGLRPGVVVELQVRRDLWKEFLARQKN